MAWKVVVVALEGAVMEGAAERRCHVLATWDCSQGFDGKVCVPVVVVVVAGLVVDAGEEEVWVQIAAHPHQMTKWTGS